MDWALLAARQSERLGGLTLAGGIRSSDFLKRWSSSETSSSRKRKG